MILIDYSSFAISSVFAAKVEDINTERHVILNQVRILRKKYGKKYGSIVFCLDSGNLWRREIFPYYKAFRKKNREESSYDWNRLYDSIKTISDELYNDLGYEVIKVNGAEADDIIATLAKRFEGPHLIVSCDKDLMQLYAVDGVAVYNSSKGGLMNCKNPEEFLQHHIIKGDSGDGIPNILSEDDTFVVKGKRQKPMTAKRLAHYTSSVPENVMDEETLERYERNKKLISLFHIPEEIEDEIMEEYGSLSPSRRKRILSYFMDHQLNVLIDHIGEI